MNVCAAPHAPENTVKMQSEATIEDLRPNISLSLAHIIMKPGELVSSLVCLRIRGLDHYM